MTRRCRVDLAILLAAHLASAAAAEPLGSADPLAADPLAADTRADPHLATIPRTRAERARIAAVTAATADFTAAEPFEANPGGAGSVRRRDVARAFSLPQENLSFEQQSTFAVGNCRFERLWVTAPASTIASDGLGSLCNTRSCQDCHVKDGRGHAPAGPGDAATSLVVRLGIPQVDEAVLSRYLGASPDPGYGHQFSDRSIAGVEAEGRVRADWRAAEIVALPGGETVTRRRPDWTLEAVAYGPLDPATAISPRVAPQMIGLGLVEAIPAADILAHADPQNADGDGFSGRPSVVWSPEYDRPMPGRSGARDHADAAPAGGRRVQRRYRPGLAAPPRPGGRLHGCADRLPRSPKRARHRAGRLRVSRASLDLVTFYGRTLAVPRRDNVNDPEVLHGKAMFAQAGCIACHVSKFVTGRLEDLPKHSFQLIWPMSDFLLHDMGPGLADGLPAGSATRAEWRTAPLLGLRLTEQVSGHRQYLHDGRARSLAEAILWHGGKHALAWDNHLIALPRPS